MFGATVSANQVSPGLNDLIQSATPGTWIHANQNTFQSVWTPAEHQVGTNLKGIIEAWSGFAWDSNRGDLIIYGGGHGNYQGNDVYIWHGSDLQWERASLPTKLQDPTYIPPENYYFTQLTVDNGATPQAAHTYGNNVFLPTLDRFLTFGGYTYSSTGMQYLRKDANGNFVTTGPYLFDPSKANGNLVGGADGTGVDPTVAGGNMWQNRDVAGTITACCFGQGMAAVTQENGKDVVYVTNRPPHAGGQALFKYTINDINDPSQDTWEMVGAQHPTTIAVVGSGDIDTENNLFVRTGVHDYPTHGSFDFFYWDLNHPGATNYTRSFNVADTTNGLFNFNAIKDMGMSYDPVGKRFLLWDGKENVFTLTHSGSDFDTGWTLGTDNAPGPINPAAAPQNGVIAPDNGVLGKWKYAPELGVYVALSGVITGDVWIYKPSNYVEASTAVPLPPAGWLFLGSLGSLFFRLRQPRNRDQ